MLDSIKRDILFDIDSEELRVIVLTAEGAVFCAGHDLKELVRSGFKFV